MCFCITKHADAVMYCACASGEKVYSIILSKERIFAREKFTAELPGKERGFGWIRCIL